MYILDEILNEFNNIGNEIDLESEGLTAKDIICHFRQCLPYALVYDGPVRYALITELPEELNKWIYTGETDQNTFCIYNKEKINEIKSVCRGLGYTVTQGTQVIDFKRKKATIEYLQIKNPAAKTSIALIPWFIVPRMKYPVFTYLFTYWFCRYHSGSQRDAALAAYDLFETKIHYSVVSRRMEMAKNLLNIDEPIAIDPVADFSINDIIGDLPKLLAADIEGGHIEVRGGNQEVALKNITLRFKKITRLEPRRVPKATPPPASSTSRKKAQAGDATRKEKPARKPFINKKKLRRAMLFFIIMCRRLVLNASMKYQIFLC